MSDNVKHWYDEQDADHAPIWCGPAMARGWAAGYNAAVAAYEAELAENLRREQS